MSETQLDQGLERASGKRKTTYPRDHPTENPKPPKRTKAEIQQAAKEKKEAELAKKVAMETQKRQKVLDAEEKRKLSAQRIASLEDAVQRSQKERQNNFKRRKRPRSEIEPIVNQEEVDELETDWDEMYIDPPVQLPPESMVDTDSDGARLGISEDEDDYAYKPADHKDDEEEGASGGDVSEDSMVQPNRETQNRWEKKKKEKGKLQAEVQAHRQVAPIVYAHPDPRLLDREKDEQRKKVKYIQVWVVEIGVQAQEAMAMIWIVMMERKKEIETDLFEIKSDKMELNLSTKLDGLQILLIDRVELQTMVTSSQKIPPLFFWLVPM
ncbi:hypothetical protein BYT27DRAFT_7305425 [Phlegmacium glaucopus]|nr:hypothetical protein BYT27DRAFT_7305425 [Phlegmacium glaucopus]